MSAASFLTKVVIMDFFCFDITENIFVSNIDLIDYLMVVSIIVALPNWRFDWSGSFVSVTVVMLNWRFDWLRIWFLMNLFKFFLSIAVLSRSSQTRFDCRDVLLSLNFLESFSFFSMVFCVIPKRLKRPCWLVYRSQSFFPWSQSLKRWQYCFTKQYL